MPHLNWRAKTVTLSRTEHATYQSQLELKLTPELAAELVTELKPALTSGGAELRVDLPENWTVYWKLKGGLSRLQLAHPQSGHWVATVHLTPEHAARLLEALEKLEGPIAVCALGAVAPLVNFELLFSKA